ncbi:hypothetical protein PR048_020617 [Dryococelus australis]|uniref:BED-type domain-containing protein n=1 Tax=Dryococelus australis TaxID=614101 RepID=A0ABQ9H6Z3_9NEOP|nr:hypothetical protein PR048_020617 [Dryococelus australis]
MIICIINRKLDNVSEAALGWRRTSPKPSAHTPYYPHHSPDTIDNYHLWTRRSPCNYPAPAGIRAPYSFTPWGRGGLAARLLDSHLREAHTIPGGDRSPDFCKWVSCWTMLPIGGFSRGSPVSCAAPHSPHFALIGSRDLDVNNLPNISKSQPHKRLEDTPFARLNRVRFSHVGIMPDHDVPPHVPRSHHPSPKRGNSPCSNAGEDSLLRRDSLFLNPFLDPLAPSRGAFVKPADERRRHASPGDKRLQMQHPLASSTLAPRSDPIRYVTRLQARVMSAGCPFVLGHTFANSRYSAPASFGVRAIPASSKMFRLSSDNSPHGSASRNESQTKDEVDHFYSSSAHVPSIDPNPVLHDCHSHMNWSWSVNEQRTERTAIDCCGRCYAGIKHGTTTLTRHFKLNSQ